MSSKPILYYVPGSPPVRTVLLVTDAMNFKLELKLVDMEKGEHMTPEFLAMNPQHTVPTLNDNGKFLWDSHAIVTYLIRKYGGEDHPLYPTDVYTRARIDQRLHFDTSTLFGALRDVFLPIYFEGAYEYSAKSIQSTHDAYAFMETFLAVDPYLVGQHITVADFSAITSVTQLASIVPINADKYPKLSAWIKRFDDIAKFNELNTVPMHEYLQVVDGFRAKNKAAEAAANANK